MTTYKVYCSLCGAHIATVATLPLGNQRHYKCPEKEEDDHEEVISQLYSPTKKEESDKPRNNR